MLSVNNNPPPPPQNNNLLALQGLFESFLHKPSPLLFQTFFTNINQGCQPPTNLLNDQENAKQIVNEELLQDQVVDFNILETSFEFNEKKKRYQAYREQLKSAFRRPNNDSSKIISEIFNQGSQYSTKLDNLLEVIANDWNQCLHPKFLIPQERIVEWIRGDVLECIKNKLSEDTVKFGGVIKELNGVLTTSSQYIQYLNKTQLNYVKLTKIDEWCKQVAKNSSNNPILVNDEQKQKQLLLSQQGVDTNDLNFVVNKESSPTFQEMNQNIEKKKDTLLLPSATSTNPDSYICKKRRPIDKSQISEEYEQISKKVKATPQSQEPNMLDINVSTADSSLKRTEEIQENIIVYEKDVEQQQQVLSSGKPDTSFAQSSAKSTPLRFQFPQQPQQSQDSQQLEQLEEPLQPQQPQQSQMFDQTQQIQQTQQLQEPQQTYQLQEPQQTQQTQEFQQTQQTQQLQASHYVSQPWKTQEYKSDVESLEDGEINFPLENYDYSEPPKPIIEKKVSPPKATIDNFSSSNNEDQLPKGSIHCSKSFNPNIDYYIHRKDRIYFYLGMKINNMRFGNFRVAEYASKVRIKRNGHFKKYILIREGDTKTLGWKKKYIINQLISELEQDDAWDFLRKQFLDNPEAKIVEFNYLKRILINRMKENLSDFTLS